MTINNIIPVSVIIPTANRGKVLEATLISLAKQDVHPQEIIIVDASSKPDTFLLCQKGIQDLFSTVIYAKAVNKGAAVQRNEGVQISSAEFILFCDDDILFEPFCINELWKCIQSDEKTGGVNAMITNQKYVPPGRLTSIMYKVIAPSHKTYAGKCLGPAWNLLPDDIQSQPIFQQVDWLNLGCTLYRKNALPSPPFPDVFKGYSMMEDLTLSLTVGKNWKLYNVRSARIFHDSQPGSHKSNTFELSKMELVNRHYVMTKILEKDRFSDYMKLLLLELFFLASLLGNKTGIKNFPSAFAGKLSAIPKLFKRV